VGNLSLLIMIGFAMWLDYKKTERKLLRIKDIEKMRKGLNEWNAMN